MNLVKLQSLATKYRKIKSCKVCEFCIPLHVLRPKIYTVFLTRSLVQKLARSAFEPPRKTVSVYGQPGKTDKEVRSAPLRMHRNKWPGKICMVEIHCEAPVKCRLVKLVKEKLVKINFCPSVRSLKLSHSRCDNSHSCMS